MRSDERNVADPFGAAPFSSHFSSQARCCLTVGLLAFFSPAIAEEFPTSCLSPDNENPETVLRYVLDGPEDGRGLDRVHCMVQRGSSYPPAPRPNPRRPNVFRSYKILSITEGKPYKGQETKRIRIEFDYVAKLSERYLGGEITCKRMSNVITAYHTKKGWIVSQPADGNEFHNLKQLLAADRQRLDKDYTLNHMGGVRELSARIETLSIGADRCPLPSK